MNPRGTDEVMSVFTMDSTDVSCMAPDLPGTPCVPLAAVEWLELQQMIEGHDYKLRDFIFTHRPLQEYMHLANLYHYQGHKHEVIGC